MTASTASDDVWRRGPGSPLAWSLWLYVRYPLLPGLALLAATGRALQLGWTDQPATTYLLLELVVEPARVLIGVGVVGAGSIRRGFATLRRLWARRRAAGASVPPMSVEGSHDVSKGERTSPASELPLWERARALSGRLLGSLIAIAAFILLGNWCIDAVAQAAFVHQALDAALGVQGPPATAAAVYFLKNLLVIPIVIIWNGGMYRLLRDS